MDVGNLISGSSAFSKSNLNICKFSVHILLKLSLKDFEHQGSNLGFLQWKHGVFKLLDCQGSPLYSEFRCGASVGFLTWYDGELREPLVWRHSSVLAWRIPGTEEPGGLHSTGLTKIQARFSD